jgi:hypothetical protein
MGGVSTMTALFFYDPESLNWGYRVPVLHIVGGGQATRAEAEADCLAAIAFALEDESEPGDETAEAVRLEVTISPHAA